MKKCIFITIMILLLAGTSFSAELTADADEAGGTLHATTPADQDISKLSTGVYAAASYSALGYAIATYHIQGTKAYGTSFDATALFWDDVGAGGSLVTPTSSSVDEAFADWTEM